VKAGVASICIDISLIMELIKRDQERYVSMRESTAASFSELSFILPPHHTPKPNVFVTTSRTKCGAIGRLCHGLQIASVIVLWEQPCRWHRISSEQQKCWRKPAEYNWENVARHCDNKHTQEPIWSEQSIEREHVYEWPLEPLSRWWLTPSGFSEVTTLQISSIPIWTMDQYRPLICVLSHKISAGVTRIHTVGLRICLMSKLIVQ